MRLGACAFVRYVFFFTLLIFLYCVQARENPSSLESMLILPVQRITRYHLLLQEALKNTDRSSHDFMFLVKVRRVFELMMKFTDVRLAYVFCLRML